MKRSKNFENRIRGWLPQSPKLPSQSNPAQTPQEPKLPPKRKVTVLQLIVIVVVVDAYFFAVFFQFSTLTVVLLIVTSSLAIAAFALRRTAQRTVFRAFKHAFTFMAIFMLAFTSVGIYLYYTSGYPPTYVPDISFPKVLDASLTQYLQDVEQAAGFRFLQAQHFGTVGVTALTLRSGSNESVSWMAWIFQASDVNSRITIGESAGYPYGISSDALFRRIPFPANYPSTQEVEASFEQIDSLGLRWFYDQAVEAYQNRTTDDQSIVSLGVDIGFDSLNNYQGMTITLNGRALSHDSVGRIVFPSVFTVEFEPNGNILSVNT